MLKKKSITHQLITERLVRLVVIPVVIFCRGHMAMLLGSVTGLFLQAVLITFKYKAYPPLGVSVKRPQLQPDISGRRYPLRRNSQAFQSQCGVLLNTEQFHIFRFLIMETDSIITKQTQ